MNTPSSSGSSSSDQQGPKADAVVRQLLPLTVWLCSDATNADTDTSSENGGSEQRGKNGGSEQRGKNGVCLRHRRAVGGELARHLIAACTGEGDLVAEAYTSSEVTLVAAAGLGRRAVACVSHFPLAQHIGSRLRATLAQEQLAGVGMRACRPEQMHHGLADHLGKVGLVVAAPPPYEASSRINPGKGEGGCPACRTGAGQVTEQQLRGFLAAAWRVLRWGGHLAVITTTRYEGGRLVDPAPHLIRQARAVGFQYSQHVIALRVPVTGDDLVVQAGPSQLAQLRDVGSRALPPAMSVHADVCLFTKPQTGTGPGTGAAGSKRERA